MCCAEKAHGTALRKDRLNDIVAALVDVVGDVLAKIDLQQTSRQAGRQAGRQTSTESDTQTNAQPQKATESDRERLTFCSKRFWAPAGRRSQRW